MTSTSTAILTNPAPCSHIVYPYTNQTYLAEAVSLFASSGLRDREAVILMMSQEHYGEIREHLTFLGFDLPILEDTGQLVCVKAEDLMSRFIFNGIIDEHRFKTIVGDLIEKARTFFGSGGSRPVRVFGEMVNLIWGYDIKSTTRLEELWNQVIATHSVPLLCAYALTGTPTSQFPKSLLSLHSDAIA